MITTFEIDQSKINAPTFPRPLAWWHGFVPTWPGVSVTAGPGETVRVQIDGSRKRGQALGDWLRTAGTGGRLADAVTEIGA